MLKTPIEFRELTSQLKLLSNRVDSDLEKVDFILDSTKETMGTVKESLKFININVLKQAAGIFALLPAIKFGWNLIRKIKSKRR